MDVNPVGPHDSIFHLVQQTVDQTPIIAGRLHRTSLDYSLPDAVQLLLDVLRGNALAAGPGSGKREDMANTYNNPIKLDMDFPFQVFLRDDVVMRCFYAIGWILPFPVLFYYAANRLQVSPLQSQ